MTQAAIYERDGNDQQSYFLLLRHALLILDHLSKHPESKQEPFKTALVEAHRTVRRDLGKLETLKPVLDRKYQKYVELADRDRRNRQKGGAYAEIPNDDVFGNDPSIDKAAYGTVSDSRLYGNTHALQPGQHRDLAVKIHTSETRRRHTARNATRLGGEEERDRRQGGVWDGRSAELNGAVSDHSASGESYRMIRDAGRQRDSFFWQGHSPSGDGNRRSAKGQTFSYPNVPRNQTHPLPTSETNSGPVLPPKVFLHDRQGPEPDLQPLDLIKQTSSTGPALPDKVLEDDPSCQGTWSNATSQSSDLNTSSYSFVPSAYLEDGTPLRTVFLPPSIRKQFLRVAEPNTRRNLETCAFLCGTLISNALFVSKLVIPEQVSTSDTCEMTNEAAFFDYCDMEDLMVLGWIHTHPSQTCFMSSRDLHTHAAYQAMMAESIAIVCAPSKDPSYVADSL